MYYVMEYDEPSEGSGYMEIEDGDARDSFVNWGIGRANVAVPSEGVTIDVIPYDGYQGDPPELSDINVPLMSDRLRRILTEAGVNNIVYHPVELRNTETDQRYVYHAFNLEGLVSATDLNTSEIESHDGDSIGDSSIKHLVLEESKIHGLLAFRLAENFMVILVHKKVRDWIESRGIHTVKFITPEDYYRL